MLLTGKRKTGLVRHDIGTLIREIHADVNAGAVLAGGVENLGSDTSAGFLLSAGLNYKINNHLKAYGEYKYTDVSFEDTTSGTKYDFDLDTSSLMFGVSYHF